MPEKTSAVELTGLLGVLRRRLLTVVFVTLPVVAGTVYLTSLLPTLYRAEVMVLVEPIAYQQAALSEVVPRSLQLPVIQEEASRVETEIGIATAGPVITALIEKLDLRDAEGELRESISTSGPLIPLLPWPSVSVKGRRHGMTEIMELRGYAADADDAAVLANTLAELYVQSKQLAAQEQLKQALAFLDAQMVELKQAYLDSRLALQRYQELNATVDLGREITAAIDSLIELNRQEQQYAMNLELAKVAMEPLDRELRRVLSSQVVDDLFMHPTMESLRERLENLEVSRNSLDSGSAELEEVNQEIMTIREQIRQTITPSTVFPRAIAETVSNELIQQYVNARIELIVLTAQQDAVKEMVVAQRRYLQSLPAKASALAELELDADATAQIYSEALQLRGSLAVATAMRVSNVRILTPAKAPNAPYCPVLPLNVAASLAMGLALGMFVALIREYCDDRITDPTVAETLLEAPCLGSLTSSRRKRDRESFAKDPRSPHVRAYRSLRNRIWNAAGVRKCRTAAIVSAVPGEGRTNTCVNLALSATQEYDKVLIVDTDLQKPSLHESFDLEVTPGLTNYLFENAAWDEVIRPTDAANLHIMPAGEFPTDSAAILRSPEFLRLIEKLHEEYGCVIFDTPPVLVVNDVVILARSVESLLVIMRSGVTRERDLKSLARVFEGTDVKPTGSVMIGPSSF